MISPENVWATCHQANKFDNSKRLVGSTLLVVHGEGQNEIHLLLRVFDLSYEYGPCAGVTRLERWRRAKAMSLNPPDEICQILETKQGTFDDSYKQSVLYREV